MYATHYVHLILHLLNQHIKNIPQSTGSFYLTNLHLLSKFIYMEGIKFKSFQESCELFKFVLELFWFDKTAKNI